jgi:hypothetical protein
MKIHVTKKDIEDGIKKSCIKCPITLVIRRETGKCYRVRSNYVLWSHWQLIKLPESAQVFIARVDSGKPVRPFTFSIDFPASETKKRKD